MYSYRFYRDWTHSKGLVASHVHIGESDLFIRSERDLRAPALEALRAVRDEIESVLARDPGWGASLAPRPAPRGSGKWVRAMARAGNAWNVGPMAAVAGAVAQAVGEALARKADTVLVENGGDLFLRSAEPVRLCLYAGEGSPFRDRIVFEVDASDGLGVCTSSSAVGPSVSFGRADAVTVVDPDAARADAAATALANRIHSALDVDLVLGQAEEDGTLHSVIAAAQDRLGVWGDLRFLPRTRTAKQMTPGREAGRCTSARETNRRTP